MNPRRRRNAKREVRLHYALAVVWVLLLIPTLLLWKNSVLWVAGMSLYANVAGHWAAAQGTRAELESGSE